MDKSDFGFERVDLTEAHNETVEQLPEDELTESNFMTSPADLEEKPFPKWLLYKASYEQLDTYVNNNFFKNTKFHFRDYTWNDAVKLVFKLERAEARLYESDEGSELYYLAKELRAYLDFWGEE